MTVAQLCQQGEFTPLTLPNGDREISSVYVGDLLSWVMSRAPADSAWITIMSNQNILAVATLCDTACIILAEGVDPDHGVLRLAEEKGVNLLKSEHSASDIAVTIKGLL